MFDSVPHEMHAESLRRLDNIEMPGSWPPSEEYARALEQAPDKELTAKAAADLFAQVYDKTDPSTKEFKCPLPQPPASD